MAITGFFPFEQKSWWQKFWDGVTYPIRSIFGIVIEPITSMVVILLIGLIVMVFIIKPKVGLRL